MRLSTLSKVFVQRMEISQKFEHKGDRAKSRVKGMESVRSF